MKDGTARDFVDGERGQNEASQGAPMEEKKREEERTRMNI